MENKRIGFITKRGFTLIELLFSLNICLLIILNVLPVVKMISAKDKINVTTSFYAIGAKQIAKLLYTAKNISINENLMYHDANDESYTISFNNDRVVKEPGFDIIIRDVKSLQFYQKGKNIYMYLNDGKNDYHYLIATNYETIDEKNDETVQN